MNPADLARKVSPVPGAEQKFTVPTGPYARAALRQHRIDPQDVEETFRRPVEIIPARSGGSWRLGGGLNLLVSETGTVLEARVGNGVLRFSDVQGDFIEMSADAEKWMHRLGICRAEVIEAARNPHLLQRGMREALWHTRGALTVLISSDGVALVVRRDLPPRAHEINDMTRAKPGGHGWTPPGDPTQFRQMLHDHGFQTRLNGSGHYAVTHPQVPGVKTSIPGTPDRSGRWARNHAARIQRMFGIELHPDAGGFRR